MATVARPRLTDVSARIVAIALLSSWCLLMRHRRAGRDVARHADRVGSRHLDRQCRSCAQRDASRAASCSSLCRPCGRCATASGSSCISTTSSTESSIRAIRRAAKFGNLLARREHLEAIEDFLFVDFSGNISQQVLSPFGPRPVSTANFSNNRVETRAYQVSPYARGRFPDGRIHGAVHRVRIAHRCRRRRFASSPAAGSRQQRSHLASGELGAGGDNRTDRLHGRARHAGRSVSRQHRLHGHSRIACGGDRRRGAK